MQSVTLLIDKRLELSTKYKKLLETKNNSVLVSKNLISAMKIIQDREPDLIIISDSIDSDLSNYCKKIRALTYNMRPIIVAVSKSAELDDRLKVLEAGADDFISEPVNSDEFIMRMKAHLRREYESNMDSKKLLPSKNYSLRALKRIIKTETPWAVMLVTIDNFKNYKESYTELASDKLVQTFCAIIQSTLSENDYFGSIADDEFLIITDQYKADKMATFLTFAFESVSPKFYSQQDLNRGYIIMQGDEYAGRRSEFVHTTIGIVTNEFNKFDDITQLVNSLVQTRNMACISSKSNYLIERPKISAENAVVQKEYNRKISIIETDEAMKLLLKTILELQGFEIVEKENLPAVIILDAGDIETQEGLNTCKELKNNEFFINTKLIVTSVFHDKETILNCGADLYLPKPYELPHLIKWVETFVKEFNQ
ncbi:response regulator [bacterium]|nr:response regulator [bacterium]